MSLLSFTKNLIKENPYILLSSNEEASYRRLFTYYRLQEKRFPIESFINVLFYDSLCKCSQNVIEYDILSNRLKRISQLSQSIFDLSFSVNTKQAM